MTGVQGLLLVLAIIMVVYVGVALFKPERF